jgi:iron complex transport system ATP-binding protein
MIELLNLSTSYNGKVIIKDLNLKFRRGEITSILGPNGSGKTTLLKTISGFLKYKGKIIIDGKDLKSISFIDLYKDLSYLPQKIQDIAELTVIEFMYTSVAGFLDSIERDFKKNMIDIMDKFGIIDFKDRYINTLSGGEFQKVLIASCFLKNPKIVLLDEPLNNLDIKNQLEIIDIVKKIVYDKNITLISVFHDINMALKISDYLVFMRDGKVISDCKKDEINSDIIENVFQIKCRIFSDDGVNRIIF